MADVFRQHGAFSWCELITGNLAGSKEFYSQLFAWEMEDIEMQGVVYTVLKAGDAEVGGMMTTPPEPQGVPPYWGVYVTVDDVDATAARAQELGGQVLLPPRDVPDVGRFCVIKDPQGAVISAITYARS